MFDDEIEHGGWRASMLANRLGVDVTVGSRVDEVVTQLRARRYDLLIVDSLRRLDDSLGISALPILTQGMVGDCPNDRTPVILYTSAPALLDHREEQYQHRNIVTVEKLHLGDDRFVRMAADILGLTPISKRDTT